MANHSNSFKKKLMNSITGLEYFKFIGELGDFHYVSGELRYFVTPELSGNTLSLTFDIQLSNIAINGDDTGYIGAVEIVVHVGDVRRSLESVAEDYISRVTTSRTLDADTQDQLKKYGIFGVKGNLSVPDLIRHPATQAAVLEATSVE